MPGFSLASFPPTATHVHLIGVAGSGMSGLAWLFLQRGYRVSGCDRSTTSETERLRQAGLDFYCPQTAESVSGADLVVYTSAVKPGNLAYDAAVAAGVPLWRRAEALAALMADKDGFIVSGTHGKTTTSSMASYVLREAGAHPSWYIGAEVPLLGANAGYDPAGADFVAEGDESDGTLVNFHPRHAIVLNVEAEHLDHYTQGLEQIYGVFGQLLSQTRDAFFYCADDAGACEVARRAPRPERGVSFGFGEGADYRATDVRTLGQSTCFTVVQRGQALGEMVLNIPGRHNVSNALGVIAFALERGLDLEKIRTALSGFRGAKRRFETKYRSERLRLVDDYGHHPSEVAATLAAAREQHSGRIVVVFQPHRFTRTQLLRKEFGACFAQADVLFVTDVYAASEPPIEGISGQTILDEVKASGAKTQCFSAPLVATAHVAVGNALRPGDLLITLGAGNVHEVGTRLIEDLRVMDGILTVLNEADAVVRLYEPMNRHTTLLVGGPAQYWIEPRSVASFQRLVKHLRDQALAIRVLGRGSNLLVRDGGIRGAVVHLSKGEFSAISVEGMTITAGAGVRLKALATAARTAGIGGFEWMEGIPGNVGGALRMNAGAMGVQTFDQVVSVEMLDGLGELITKQRAEIEAHYRSVPELSTHYAVRATFIGQPAPVEQIDRLLGESKQKRRTSQPIAASAGCCFKNPGPCPAGKLIDELGLKDASVGKARVSMVHGNFIVNEGGASAREILALIDQIKAKAKAERDIDLECEVQIIGEA